MALNVKQIVAIGLGLGVATAFGYHSITRPASSVSVQPGFNQLQPIESFDLEPVELPSPEHLQNGVTVDTEDSLASATDDTSFSMPMITPKADSLVLSNEMVEPLSNADVDSFDISLDGFGLETEATNEAIAVEPSDFPLALEHPAVAPEHQPVAPEEMLESAAAPMQIESKRSIASMNTGSPRIQTTAIPLVTRQLQNGSPETKKVRVWKDNPFMMEEPERQDTIVESSPSSAQRSPNTDFNTQLASEVSTELNFPNLDDAEQLLVDHRVRGMNAQLSADPSRQNQSPSSVLGSSAAIGSSIEGVPSNSVLSLMDPIRGDMPSVQVEPAKDYSFAAAETLAIPLNDVDAQQAVHHIEYGKELSRRGAGFSAREEFLKALQVLTGANDRQSGNTAHSAALRRAMLIIEEAEDFAIGNADQQIQMEVADVIESHRSGVVSRTEAASMTIAQAIDRYFSTAQQELDLAGGRSAVSAEVFFCLGKLHAALPATRKAPSPLETAKAVVYHQAALMSYPNHHQSANELGVLFARNGRLHQAKQLFERSLMANAHPQTWKNLATAHRRLGEHEFARRAENEHQLLAQRTSLGQPINWQQIEQFNAETDTPIVNRVAARPPAPAANGAQASELGSQSTERKSLSDRLKDLF